MAILTERIPIKVSIPNGQSLSGEVNIAGHRIVGIQMPAAWTAAGISFAALVDQSGTTSTFGSVVDQAHAEVTITTPGAGEYIAIAPTAPLCGLGRIKVRSGTAGTPVNQGAQRDFWIICVPA